MVRIAIILLFLTSCCPKITSVSGIETKTDTVRISQVITIPADSVFVKVPIASICDTIVRFKTIYAKHGELSTAIQRQNDTIYIRADIAEQSRIIDSLVNITTTVHEQTNHIIEQCTSWAHKFYRTSFWIITAALILIIYLRRI